MSRHHAESGDYPGRDTFHVRPRMNYELLGTSIKLDSSRVYPAVHADNLPDWRAKGKIFVLVNNGDSFMLESGDYDRLD